MILLHGIGGAAWGAVPGTPWALPGYEGKPLLPVTGFAEWAAALDATAPAGALDVLGHSIGGMLAIEFALRFPHRVRRLVLYATTPAFGGRDPAFAEAFLRERLAPLDAGQTMAEIAQTAIPSMMADAAAAAPAIAAMAAVPAESYRATVRALTTFDRRADLPRLAAPTLLIAGERDPLAPVKTMQRMADAIPGARLVVIPGAGHLAHLEAPAGFLAALEGF